MITSCGVLIKYRNQFLVCKSTNFPVWGIPKGKMEDGESELAAALRETLEETNISLTEDQIKGEYIRYKTSKKNIVVFLHESSEKYENLFCSTLLLETMII